MRALVLTLLGMALGSCSLVGFDDLVTEPCAAVADDSIEAIRAGNELCASIESTSPAAEGTTWVCREPIGEDLFCVQSSVDNDNDGVGAESQGGLDCDDDDPTVFGGQEEATCDGKDNDCDGLIDENLISAVGAMRVYGEPAREGSFAAGAERLSFIGRRSGTAVIVLDRGSEEFDQSAQSSFAAAPVGNEAVVLKRPLQSGSYQLSRTDGPAPEMDNLAGEDIVFPAIGVGEDSYLAAWFGGDAASCGAPAGRFRYTTGLASNGLDQGPPMDLPDASPIQAPVVIPVGPSEFLVFAANGSAIDAHLVNLVGVVASVSFPFDDSISAFAVAVGEGNGDALTLGLSAVVGCGSRELVFRELNYDLTTGIISPGELALTEESDVPPGAPAIVWSAEPRGFVVTWVAGDAQRTLLGRLIGDDDFAGEPFDLSGAIPDAAAFPYGAALAPAMGGGLRVWTYAQGPEEGVYEIALGCNAP